MAWIYAKVPNIIISDNERIIIGANVDPLDYNKNKLHNNEVKVSTVNNVSSKIYRDENNPF